MKKCKGSFSSNFIIIAVILTMIACFIALLIYQYGGYHNDEYKDNQRFVSQASFDMKFSKIGIKSNINIIVDRETDVEYMVISTDDKVVVQPLYNPDGSLRTRE